MELKKLHMGTMSYGADSMDEVAHQLALAFGMTAEQGMYSAEVHWFGDVANDKSCKSAHFRRGSTSTGVQFATRGRRDMTSRVKDVVTSLALCHNVRLLFKMICFRLTKLRLHPSQMTMGRLHIKRPLRMRWQSSDGPNPSV